ncbi:hypothetical protein CEP52_017337 [Fusarium oligoseptatum]|uniref:Uncharacterized protein n=1 Tax=Fusarium oligoseptatum TaxID=2604345 RepID=A0A428RT48_9HYPO|nr:hypothetical protein CEP52_017337 [Fusarium oligoseptatum]
MTLGETLATGGATAEEQAQNASVVVESVRSGEQESESEASSVIEVREEAVPHQRTTRSAPGNSLLPVGQQTEHGYKRPTFVTPLEKQTRSFESLNLH